MGKIKNEKYASNKLVSSFGLLEFDAEGILVAPKDLGEEAVESLLKLKGFEAIVSDVKEVKGETTKQEVKAPEVPEKDVTEEAEKPKRSSRKAKSE